MRTGSCSRRAPVKRATRRRWWWTASIARCPRDPGWLERDVRPPARLRWGGVPRLAEAARHGDSAGRAGGCHPGAAREAVRRSRRLADGRGSARARAGRVAAEQLAGWPRRLAASGRVAPVAVGQGSALVPRPQQLDREAIPIRSGKLPSCGGGLGPRATGDSWTVRGSAPVRALLSGEGAPAGAAAHPLDAG